MAYLVIRIDPWPSVYTFTCLSHCCLGLFFFALFRSPVCNFLGQSTMLWPRFMTCPLPFLFKNHLMISSSPVFFPISFCRLFYLWYVHCIFWVAPTFPMISFVIRCVSRPEQHTYSSFHHSQDIIYSIFLELPFWLLLPQVVLPDEEPKQVRNLGKRIKSLEKLFAASYLLFSHEKTRTYCIVFSLTSFSHSIRTSLWICFSAYPHS